AVGSLHLLPVPQRLGQGRARRALQPLLLQQGHRGARIPERAAGARVARLRTDPDAHRRVLPHAGEPGRPGLRRRRAARAGPVEHADQPGAARAATAADPRPGDADAHGPAGDDRAARDHDAAPDVASFRPSRRRELHVAIDITTFVGGRAFLEGPQWRGDSLYTSDLHRHEVIRVDASGAVEVVATLDGPPSGLGWLPDGRMLIVSMDDRRVLRREADGTLVEHADLSSFSPFQINDMVVDTRGHAFVGQMGYDLHGGGGAGAQPAALLRVDPDGTAHEAAPDLRVANGMAVATDDRTLVVAESAGKDLVAFDLADDGTLA